jgi:hypothetical protein
MLIWVVWVVFPPFPFYSRSGFSGLLTKHNSYSRSFPLSLREREDGNEVMWPFLRENTAYFKQKWLRECNGNERECHF